MKNKTQFLFGAALAIVIMLSLAASQSPLLRALFQSNADANMFSLTNAATIQATNFVGNGRNVTNISGTNLIAGTVNSNALDTATKAQLALAGSGGGGSQTPWTGNINGATHDLTSVGTVSAVTVAASGEISGSGLTIGHGVSSIDGGAIITDGNGSVSFGGDLAVEGQVEAGTFNGDGSAITGITQGHVVNLTSDLGLKAPLASPAFTGDPTGPTNRYSTSADRAKLLTWGDYWDKSLPSTNVPLLSANNTFTGNNFFTNLNGQAFGTVALANTVSNFPVDLNTFGAYKLLVLTNDAWFPYLTNGPGRVQYELTCLGATNHTVHIPTLWRIFNSNFISSVSSTNSDVMVTNGHSVLLTFWGDTNAVPVATNSRVVIGAQ